MARKLNIVRIPLEERFWQKVNKSQNHDECWLWTGYTSKNGYGSIFAGPERKPRMIQAHVAVYLLTKGTVPPGHDVMHSCDVRNCVNPKHLSVGTRKDNMVDAVNKNRLRRGADHYNTRLTDEQVREIRELPVYYGCCPQYAKMYNISREQIRDIISRKRRAGVK